MPFIPAPGVLEIAQQFSTNGGPAFNIWHVAHLDSTSWTSTQIDSMLNVFNNWEQTVGRLRRVSAVTCQNYRARDLSTQFGGERTALGNSPGSLAGVALPGNVTIAIKKDTGLAGRGNRGRVYHIGCSEAQQSGDTYAGTELTNLIAAYNTLNANVTAVANCALVIMKSQENKTVLNPRRFVTILSFTETDGVLDSQRRRLTGHNIHR